MNSHLKLIFLLYLLSASPIFAGNGDCGIFGGLSYIGKTSDNSSSVWFVFNNFKASSDFRLESQDASYSNDFQLNSNSFKIKISNKVSTGSDGDHIFYENSGNAPCAIDTKSQEGGITIPVGGGSGGGNGGLGEIVVASQQELLKTSNYHGRSISRRVLQNYLGRNQIDSDRVLKTDTHGLRLWADTRLLESTDTDQDRGRMTSQKSLLIGADTELKNEVYAGMALSLEDLKDNAFSGAALADSDGWNIGPYASILFQDRWFFDFWIGLGKANVNSNLDWLNGEFDSTRYFLSSNLTTQFYWNDLTLVPKATFYFAHIENDSYTYSGTDPDTSTSVNIKIGSDNYRYSSLTLSNEFNRIFEITSKFNFKGYIVAAMNADLIRPADDIQLLKDASVDTPNRFSGELYLGASFYIFEALELDASVGYISFFQNDYDNWSYRLSADIFVF
ncbi:autotransporter beta-domain protein [Bacteriovorax sp. BAL6_X]|uniref:autotransporter outer membrane beta-barrel domain-containing protein n=1 Tax=Bacteriovorax sp. BAL6_X TaxID=1201290 RepID=UPI000385F81C|nr:autotransporter outer membrane beta-barrel domain-containing protein [Bacteriovorax sp. BAL6_X]EPZ49327.1 autotransporter beta-domain protein [Bacteriovorax sp. BAL6_X]